MNCSDMEYIAHTNHVFGRSNLVALGERGPYRLTLPHADGVIVEYFRTTEAALRRLVELEDLLAAAHGFSRCVPRADAR